ncbi:MAG: hypothetical protein FWB91_06635 [Defluviitaleaceae bacterium]|nr:hypothetical protein [Defluviitaleaceae bacterium]
MRDLGEKWNALAGPPRHSIIYQKRILINGRAYYENNMFRFSRTNGLIESCFGIGNCISGRLDVAIVSPESESIAIPRNAKVQLQVRLTSPASSVPFIDAADRYFIDSNDSRFNVRTSTEHTDWFNFGTYFIDHRTQVADKLMLECYDAMLYASGLPFFFDGRLLGSFPFPTLAALNHICAALSMVSGETITIDPRTVALIRPGSVIQFPGFVAADNPEFEPHKSLTMREVLSFIAVEHCGNWTITDDNTLRLVVPHNDSALDTISRGDMKKNATNKSLKFNKVYLIFNDSGDYFAAGTGDTSFEAVSLWAMPDDAERILQAVSSYTYNPYNVRSADIDLRLELGDPIEVDGVSCNLWRCTLNSRLFADIEAPTRGDTDREFAFNARHSNSLRRNLSNISGRFASLILDFGEFQVAIGERVTNLDNSTTERFATMQMSLNGISLTVANNYTSLSGDVTSLRGEIAIERDRINLMVSGPMSSSRIELTCSQITAITPVLQVSATTANFSGRVNAATFAGNGALITNLNADNIATGTLALARLTNGTAPAVLVAGTGAPTWQSGRPVPTGGNNQFLTGGTGAPSWTSIRQVPTGGSTGQFLRQDSTWATVTSGENNPTAGTSAELTSTSPTIALRSWSPSVLAGVFRSATNINAGTLDNARLPTTIHRTNLIAGGTGQRIQIQSSGIVFFTGATVGQDLSFTTNGVYTWNTFGITLNASGGNLNFNASTINLSSVGRTNINHPILGGSTANQVGFYGSTGITRQTGWTNLSNSSLPATWNNTTAQTNINLIITRVNAITTWLRNIGLTS